MFDVEWADGLTREWVEIRMVCDAATLYDPDSERMLEAARMVFDLARQPLPVVVVMDGGIIQNVLTNAPVSVIAIDYDCEGTPEDELIEVPQENGEMEDAYVFSIDCEPLNDFWADFLKQWEQDE